MRFIYRIMLLIFIFSGIYCGKATPPVIFPIEKFDRTFVYSDADSDISAVLSISYPVFSGAASGVVNSLNSAVN